MFCVNKKNYLNISREIISDILRLINNDFEINKKLTLQCLHNMYVWSI